MGFFCLVISFEREQERDGGVKMTASSYYIVSNDEQIKCLEKIQCGQHHSVIQLLVSVLLVKASCCGLR